MFENAKPYLTNAKVVIDRSGKKDFGNQLAKYLIGRMNSPGQRFLGKVKTQSSKSNNLLQLADYVAGIVNRHQQNKKCAQEYRRYIAHKEMSVQIWPK